MNSLYVITNNFMELMNKAEQGELTEEEYNKLGEEIALELQQKSTNIIGYYQNENALLEAIDTQIKRLQDFKKAKKNHIDNYKKYVKENMEKLGITKIETELGTLSIAKSPISVEVVNESEIPEEYKEEVITTKEDIYKDAIKNIGTFEPMIVEEKAYNNFKRIWEKQGLGFLIQEVTRKDKCVKVHCYYGSSTYDSKEMSLLIELLVEEAKQLNIEVKTEQEIESLLSTWH